MNWFKFYAEFASDPKVQSMPEAMQRRLVMLFCLQCSDHLGKLEPEEISLALRIQIKDLEKTHALFLKKGFINEDWSIRNWRKRQAPTDPTARDRMRAMRARQSGQDRNVTRNVTPPVTGVTNSLRVEEEVEGEREGEENPPLPPAIVLGPEYRQVGEWAIQIGADVSWGRWVDQQGLCGHPAATIRRAIEEASGAGKLSQPYVAAKLRGWASEGGPPRRKGENNGKTALSVRPEETRAKIQRPDLPRTPEYEAIHRMWDDLEGNGKPKGVAS